MKEAPTPVARDQNGHTRLACDHLRGLPRLRELRLRSPAVFGSWESTRRRRRPQIRRWSLGLGGYWHGRRHELSL